MSDAKLLGVLNYLPGELAEGIYFSKIEGNELRLYAKLDSMVPLVRHICEAHRAYLLSLHAVDERPLDHTFKVHVILAPQDEDHFVSVISSLDPGTRQFPSLTPYISAANWYEREVQDMFGLIPTGHPDPRPLVLYDDWPSGQYPLRKDFDPGTRLRRVRREYPFVKVEGEGIFEVPVGPVHAGVIEPGHFRFSVAGEPIVNLEIRMGYTHKGVEKISESTPYPQGVFLAERISGDTTVAHSTAYCQAVERLASARAPERAEHIRTVFLEMERLYSHFGDIAGIALDTAFSVPAAHGYLLREKMLNLNECVTGSRLLRSVNVLGGVRKDLTGNDVEKIRAALIRMKLEFDDLSDLMLSSPSMLDRVETTGMLSTPLALALGVVGPAARASGVDRDVRRDHPYAAYKGLSFRVPVYREGDVNSRMRVKMYEVRESMSIIEQALDSLPGGDIRAGVREVPQEEVAMSLVEAPRGELMHWIMSGDGTPYRHKVRDPSFCNWLAMEQAVLGNIVPDFPLINKSFNLSYSGNDL
ncbi:hydrogenase large subunit [Methanomassiliicoccus luminyensis]|uniref:hydrogenase large subunit n=1 Tax=Methanomassiliicoccus luminyensis TaxID=1080712 RepID=UPI00036597A3|nr:NADH-quinone oxidoreductase subunit C [Methanomassiliicoccus luminyensis]